MSEIGLNYWVKQSNQKPLFEDIIWSQPEQKSLAGKLLIIGGNVHGFSASALAFASASKAGIGNCKVLLPDILRKTIGKTLLEADYTPSTPSGSFATRSLAEYIDYASWSDLVLLAGDIGRNSETSMLHESFIHDYSGLLTITKDSLDIFVNNPNILFDRPKTLIVASLAQLQRLTTNSYPAILITADMGLVALVKVLSELSTKTSVSYITKYLNNIIVAVDGKVSSTKLIKDLEIWRVSIASFASVWWLQNPTRKFEALTSGVYLHINS
jgi:hypothetical protein